jgi:Chemotaxis signal transduction protein
VSSNEKQLDLEENNGKGLFLFKMKANDNHLFAINVLSIREVIARPKFYRVPGYPSAIEGIIHLRGQVVSVIDLQKAMNGGAMAEEDKNFVILIERDNDVFGLLIGGLAHIVQIQEKDLLEAPRILGKEHFVDAMLQINNEENEQKQTVNILNVNKILDNVIGDDD